MFRNLLKQKNMKNEVLNCKLFLGQDSSKKHFVIYLKG